MKYNFINILLGISAVLTMASCEKFLTAEPLNQVSAGSFFSNETELELYANGMLNSYRPEAWDIAGGDAYSDMGSSWSSTDIYKVSANYGISKVGGWSWANVRRANILITNMSRAKDNVSDEVWNHYQGVGRFWRAYFHQAKLQSYSDIPWIDHIVDPSDSLTLYAARTDREEVFHYILEDLDYACENMSGDVSTYANRINKWVAMAYKSRICLQEGTYRKYHTTNPATNQPWNNKYESSEDLLKECIKVSKEMMDAGQFQLAKEFSSCFLSKYQEIKTNPEVIWYAEYQAGDFNILNEITHDFNSQTGSQKNAPTKPFILMFLDKEGNSVTTDLNNLGRVSIKEELVGRDPRLCKTVQHEGTTYTSLAGEILPKPMRCTTGNSGYWWTKFNVETEENWMYDRADNCIPIMRYAEVLLNYAEANAELGNPASDWWDDSIGALRKRAGITNTGVPANTDPYLLAYYTIDDNPENTQFLTKEVLECRRERVTEMAIEGRRVQDLYRWKCGQRIADRGNKILCGSERNSWAGIWVTAEEAANGLVFNGTKITFSKDKEDINGTYSKTAADDEKNWGNYCVSNKKSDANYSLSEGTYGYLLYYYNLQWKDWFYTRPISNTDTTLNPNLGQNWGWDTWNN